MGRQPGDASELVIWAKGLTLGALGVSRGRGLRGNL